VNTIDLNADLGEGFATDAEVLSLVSSANIACGFHAGDPLVMRETVAGAVRGGAVIGAHPGYPDRDGFGRRDLDASPAEITAYVIYQIGALDAVCRAAGTRVRYVKPHGALYNRAATDPVAAAAIASGVHLVDPTLTLLGLAGSQLITAARAAGLATASEAFADRGYRRDGTLAPRSIAGAVITDPEAVARRAARLVIDGRVETIDGYSLAIEADSLCVHGDTAGAASLLRLVRQRLAADGVRIAAFAT
jgi:5-oxoprolinase (ATP-hydrolysing) subunit A